LTEKARVR